MVYTQENFLPLELFDWLSEAANLKSKLSLELAKDVNNRNYAKHHQLDKTGWDLTYRNLNGDITTPTREIGDKVSEIISHINNTIKFVTNSDVPTIDNIHFLFSKTGYVVQKHIDRRFKITPPRKLEKIYKTFIFCHKEWNENWGGELCFNSGNFLPTPNRFIMYSIDELHWVNKVNDNNNAIRINFGCRFGKE